MAEGEAGQVMVTFERSLYYGVWFIAFLYGLQFYMFVHSLSLFLSSPFAMKKKSRIYVIIGAINLALIAFAIFANTVFMQEMWIDHRADPGGPLGYLAANSAVWYQTMGSVCGLLVTFIGDALMIYRCYIVYRANFWIVMLPIALYFGMVAMGAITVAQSAVPNSSFFHGRTVDFGLPFVVLSVSVNLVLTLLITYRLLNARKRLQAMLPNDSLKTYTGISAILIESALPFTVLGIIAAVLYGTDHGAAPAFMFIWGSWGGLSPQFIIFRVTVGRSWTRDFTNEFPTTGSNYRMQGVKSSTGDTTFHPTLGTSRVEVEVEYTKTTSL